MLYCCFRVEGCDESTLCGFTQWGINRINGIPSFVRRGKGRGQSVSKGTGDRGMSVCVCVCLYL